MKIKKEMYRSITLIGPVSINYSQFIETVPSYGQNIASELESRCT